VTKNPRVSIGIPVHNEQEALPELLRRLSAVLQEIPAGPHEVVFIDDGSTDGTAAILASAKICNASVVLIRLSRNFGHQAALTAALDHVSGDVTVLVDGDLQDTPEAIPTFLEQYAQGYDVVYAQRSIRQETWYLRLSYFLFYRLIDALSTIRLPLDSGDFSLLSKRVVEVLRQAPERHRYLRGLRTWAGFRQIGIPVAREERYAGRSKYNAAHLLTLAFDGIFAFSVVPLRVASLVGMAAIFTAAAFAAYSVYAKFALHQSPQGFTALILVVVFMSGVQLVFLGIIGEYMGRAYDEIKGRPHYVIDQVIKNS
jgi:dolichol-phosphate mannosyltransferase